MKALVFRCIDGNRPLTGKYLSSLEKLFPDLDIGEELEKLNANYRDKNVYTVANAYILFRKQLESASQKKQEEREKSFAKKRERIILRLPCLDGDIFIPGMWKERQIKKYPELSIEQELGRMRFWLEDNPDRMPEKDGMQSFMERWLANSARNPGYAARQNEEYEERALAREMNEYHARKRNAG